MFRERCMLSNFLKFIFIYIPAALFYWFLFDAIKYVYF